MSMKLNRNTLIAVIGVLILIVLIGGYIVLNSGSKTGNPTPSPSATAIATPAANPTATITITPAPSTLPTATPAAASSPTPPADVVGKYNGNPGGNISVTYTGVYSADYLPTIKIIAPNGYICYDGPFLVNGDVACKSVGGPYGTYSARVGGSYSNAMVGDRRVNITYSGGGSVYLNSDSNALDVKIVETDEPVDTA